jgi:hypothetical protein
MRGFGTLVVLGALIGGCSYLSEGDLADRMDLDGDGVARPDDCDDDDPDIGAAESLFFDSDGDGFGSSTPAESCAAVSSAVANSDDCDDNDATVFPGAEEICDGADTDCNGSVDDVDDPPIWYVDADDDGYGNGQAATLAACDQPSGYVANGEDCDDLNGRAFPDNKEVCDELEVDDDCNGLADDEDPNVDPETQVTVYQDEDGDGFGVEEVSSLACHAGDGWALEAGDCDDGDVERHPDNQWYRDRDEDGYGDAAYAVRSCLDVDGYVRDDQDCDDLRSDVSPAGQEICDPDDADEDCDGVVEDEDPTVYGQDSYYWDDDGDGYGDPSVEQLSCEPLSGWSLVPRDCDDADSAVNPDALEDCESAGDEDCDGYEECDDVDCSTHEWCVPFDLAGADAILDSSDSGDQLGSIVAGAGDIDGDGFDDILASCADYHPPIGSYPNARAAYLVGGPVTGSMDMTSLATAEILAEDSGDLAGISVAGLGDVDGDGFGDLVIGAPYYPGGVYPYSGAAYLLHGPLTGTVDLATAGTVITDAYPTVYEFGIDSAAAGDVDGDGSPELLIGSDDAVWLFPGTITGAASTVEATAELIVSNEPILATGQDMDGDGVGDLIVGDSSRDNAYVVLGPVTGTINLSTSADVVVPIPDWSGNRSRLTADGDLDGDGHLDLLASDPMNDDYYTTAGAVYLYSGPISVMHRASAATAVMYGESSSACAGNGLAVPGDLNNDGFDDVAIGAPWDNRAYVVLGPVSGTLSLADASRIFSNSADSFTGYDVAPGGDVDADGEPDILFAAMGGGAVFLLHGSRF